MGGLCDGDPEESFQALMDLDVCIYYTLEEIKQNQSHPVGKVFCISACTRLTKQVSVPQKSGLNPVHLCSYEPKEFLLNLILLMIFSPFAE